ncbi:MAG: sulfite exporter TauE/SafE family protein [Acidobacteria bacterium]|nr:sulfite exporter TauE/SafE family protein [Acidobacteriota bacterium]
MSPLFLALMIVMGGVAGAMGALLGLGGGVFLVPFLVLAAGLPIKTAVGISLITVIATSSTVSAHSAGRQLINLRFGMVLEVATAAGGLMGGLTAHYLSERTIEWLFAIVACAVAGVMLTRLDRRNVITEPDVAPGTLGGRFYDAEVGRMVIYRVRRLGLALLASLVAGNVSTLLGVGGGIIKVPVLNAWCGMPLRAAAATSAFMIGVTASAGAVIYYGQGHIVPTLAAATVLGVLAGSRIGLRLAMRLRTRWLKIIMSGILVVVAGLMIVRAAR